MRIGLYGLPCAGKTTLMNQIQNMELVRGSEILHCMARNSYGKEFRDLGLDEKDELRARLLNILKEKDNYIIDGHYAFGTQPVQPDEETVVFDVSMYLYTAPEIIQERMKASEKNRKYAEYDIESWQRLEMEKIREKCHKLNRDFYIISDNGRSFPDFLHALSTGFSCYRKGKEIGEEILDLIPGKNIVISDGDKTLAVQDTEYHFTHKGTKVFDGNFYTGYQTWLHWREREPFEFDSKVIHLREKILSAVQNRGVVISSGPEKVWKLIAEDKKIPLFTGNDISADTKYFVVKILREAGKLVTAYGDSMSDYYMLREADMGILLWNGRFSRSLKERDISHFYIMNGEDY